MAAKRDGKTPKRRQPLGGVADVGTRIAEARKRQKLTKAGLARLLGKGKNGWRLVHKWEVEGQIPDSDSLALLAKGLQVTTDELMGIAAGQEPPFSAWQTFKAEVAAEGEVLTEDEERGLKSIYWGLGREPTARGYWSALMALRGGTRTRGRA